MTVLFYYSSLGEEPSRIHAANWLSPERVRARPVSGAQHPQFAGSLGRRHKA